MPLLPYEKGEIPLYEKKTDIRNDYKYLLTA